MKDIILYHNTMYLLARVSIISEYVGPANTDSICVCPGHHPQMEQGKGHNTHNMIAGVASYMLLLLKTLFF